MRWLVALLLVFPTLAIGQSKIRCPHQLALKVDVPLLGAGLALGGAALYLRAQNTGHVSGFPPRLDVYDVPEVERFTTRLWNPTHGRISDALLVSSVTGAGLLAVRMNVHQNIAVNATMGLEVAMITGALTYNAKLGTDRYRPYMYNHAAPWSERLSSDGTQSFFSGHTSMAAAATFFSARLWNDYHPGHKAAPLVWTAAAVLPALTGIERVNAGKHFPSDVLVGYVTGAAIGYLVPVLHRKVDWWKRPIRKQRSPRW